jgi:uncharacterized membrane protein
MAVNPYAAPTAAVDDRSIAANQSFIEGGQTVPAGHGLTWYQVGFQLFMQQPMTAIVMAIVSFAVLLGIWVVQMALAWIFAPLGVLGSLASIFVGPFLLAGWMLGLRELDEGGELRVGHLFEALTSHAKPLVILSLLVLVVSIVAIAVGGAIGAVLGFAAFGVGGAIGGKTIGLAAVLMSLLIMAVMLPVYMIIWFAPALVVLQDLRPIDALKNSFFGCLKNIVPFLLYGIVGIVLALVATIPLMLGWLVLGPVVVGSVYAGYRDIFVR